MILFRKRRERESIIVSTMIRMYCTGNHGERSGLCDDCSNLNRYAADRLQRCIFGEHKPVCKECPVHCYSPIMREKMRIVMRWAGPKMLYRHPLYALIHMIDSTFSPKKPVQGKVK
jgi:hypothetical protein